MKALLDLLIFFSEGENLKEVLFIYLFPRCNFHQVSFNTDFSFLFSPHTVLNFSYFIFQLYSFHLGLIYSFYYVAYTLDYNFCFRSFHNCSSIFK